MTGVGLYNLKSGEVVNTDIKSTAAIVGSKLATNVRKHIVRGPVQDIDNGAGVTADHVLIRPSTAITITAARVVYTDATTGTVAAATVGLGTTVAGVDIVAATALENTKAVGTITALTLAAAAIAANTPLIQRHTGIAATAAGQYYVEIEFTIDD